MWYPSWLNPTALVQLSGMTSPMMCPKITTRMPKWKSGLPIRSSRLSYSWDDRVVQPNLSYRYRHQVPTTRIAIVTYGTMSQKIAPAFMPASRSFLADCRHPAHDSLADARSSGPRPNADG